MSKYLDFYFTKAWKNNFYYHEVLIFFATYCLFIRSLKQAIIKSQTTKFKPLPAPNTVKLAEIIYQEGGVL